MIIRSFVHVYIFFSFFSSGNDIAVDKALENLPKYLVVGLVERYIDFLKVLECLLPSYFTGITELFEGKFNMPDTYEINSLPLGIDVQNR